MRLKKPEIESIKLAVKEFDESARVYLFGSRVDETKRGGDIDILIVSDKIRLSEKLEIEAHLETLIGEQKIDLVATPKLDTAFLKYIYEQSVQL